MAIGQDLSEKQPGSQLDPAFYDEIRDARGQHALVDRFVVAPGSGRAVIVGKGHLLRIVEETGPQIGTLALWDAHNPALSLLAGSTWPQEGVYIQPYRRLISELPWRRPLMTCIADTVVTQPRADGVYHHHFVGTHCSPELMEMRFGLAGLPACRVHLVEAIKSHGLDEADLHDSVSLFQKSEIDLNSGKIRNAPSDARAGDYIEFYAEIDLLVAIATCPFGDGVRNPAAPHGALRPLRVELYDTGVVPKAYPRWRDWRPSWRGHWVPPADWRRDE
jgi:uncharacterized protein